MYHEGLISGKMALLSLSYFFAGCSIFLFVTVAFGLLRFNNPYTSIHIMCMNDMVAVPLLLLSVALLFYNIGDVASGNKVLLILVSFYIVTPITGYVLAKICFFIKNFPVDIEKKSSGT